MLFFYLLSAISAQKVDADATTSISATTVYYTVTQNGVLLTIPSIYTQQFAQLHGSVPQAKVGSIGMGSLTGDVGDIRSYEMTTVNGGGGIGGGGGGIGYMGGLGVVVMMLL